MKFDDKNNPCLYEYMHTSMQKLNNDCFWNGVYSIPATLHYTNIFYSAEAFYKTLFF